MVPKTFKENLDKNTNTAFFYAKIFLNLTYIKTFYSVSFLELSVYFTPSVWNLEGKEAKFITS